MTEKEAFDATRTRAEGDNVKPWHLYYPMAHMDYYQEAQGSFVGRVTFNALGSVVTRCCYCRWKAGWNPGFAMALALRDEMDQVASPIHRAVQIAGSVGLPFAEFPVPRAGGKCGWCTVLGERSGTCPRECIAPRMQPCQKCAS